jgi:hypothetical protein
MLIKTKKYKLDPKLYRTMAMKNVMIDLWWVFLIPIAIALVSVFTGGVLWFLGGALLLTALYIAFWYIQFTGISNLEQYKMLFEKLSYEITSKSIMIKLNPKQGMPVNWENIKKAESKEDEFLFTLSRAQFIHLPHKVFNNNNEIQFLNSILKRKGYIQ